MSEEHGVLGEKAKDFESFKKVSQLMANGAHLTSEGLDLIIKIKSEMNKGRQ